LEIGEREPEAFVENVGGPLKTRLRCLIYDYTAAWEGVVAWNSDQPMSVGTAQKRMMGENKGEWT
jgi:hypothetical protein